MDKDQKIPRYKHISELDISEYKNLNKLVACQIEVWPEHEGFLATSLGNQSDRMLQEIDGQASSIVMIAEDNFGGLKEVCAGYKYFCQNMILEAELFFRRYKRYQRSSFKEAFDDVYSNPEIMKNYMNGLLLSGVFWSNHAHALKYYKNNYLPRLPENFSHLEVGPGHGTLLQMTAETGRHGVIEAWDVSPSSIEATRRTITTMGIADSINLICQDMFVADENTEKFDSIVVSELLEHLEDPLAALRALRPRLKANGHILVNMPVNSPAPDHLYLVKKPSEVITLVSEAGYAIVDNMNFPMTGYTLEQCSENDLTITCIVVATKL